MKPTDFCQPKLEIKIQFEYWRNLPGKDDFSTSTCVVDWLLIDLFGCQNGTYYGPVEVEDVSAWHFHRVVQKNIGDDDSRNANVIPQGITMIFLQSNPSI